ncbi:MAG: hypothetical protein A3G76_13030 [Acidobacteria bacterium RIFCSPLOWO2_12_FULL_65_11]|nr:MAG: hypothetical protein A3H95_03420 [Acidobacteria bacterium RIFCSPLOWO2_02_FULL_64_15]OFW32422.1 MAG: hypothetical protein A3G76_13030 [Acidobacteria bacterium RIFCSPLOWO2_12_FULL_65_11]
MDPSLDDETRSRLPPAAVGRRGGSAALASGARVGAYVIDRLIARGGSARVYRAVDQTLGRSVALKVIEEAIDLIDRALEAADEPAPMVATPSRPATSDALALSQFAAARAAFDLGRTTRAHEIFDRLYRDRGAVWIDAGIELASLLEKSGNLTGCGPRFVEHPHDCAR